MPSPSSNAGPPATARVEALVQARRRMGKFFRPNQVLGRRRTIGCVALEITQRCNLDCTLCYLSTNSEHVPDVPLDELFARLEAIARQFGALTVVQITGGDPTLRPRGELIAIVRKASELGLLPRLATNGITATADLLRELSAAGLNGVSFHVDLTQERPGYPTEVDLNAVREEYLSRVRGLKLEVVFTMTVCRENLGEIPELVRFFRRHADRVDMVSFQLQADAGRGLLRERDRAVSLDSVRERIARGAETRISWDTILVGHPSCHRVGVLLEANGTLYDFNDDPEVFNGFISDFGHLVIDRRRPRQALRMLARELARHPSWLVRAARFAGPRLWRMRRDLIAARGRVHTLSFLVQDFMDASSLDPERVHACSFMIQTADGPVSMCAYNATRDAFLFPLLGSTAGGTLLPVVH